MSPEVVPPTQKPLRIAEFIVGQEGFTFRQLGQIALPDLDLTPLKLLLDSDHRLSISNAVRRHVVTSEKGVVVACLDIFRVPNIIGARQKPSTIPSDLPDYLTTIGYIANVVVAEEHQRKGVCRKMLNMAAEAYFQDYPKVEHLFYITDHLALRRFGTCLSPENGNYRLISGRICLTDLKEGRTGEGQVDSFYGEDDERECFKALWSNGRIIFAVLPETGMLVHDQKGQTYDPGQVLVLGNPLATEEEVKAVLPTLVKIACGKWINVFFIKEYKPLKPGKNIDETLFPTYKIGKTEKIVKISCPQVPFYITRAKTV